MKLVANPFIIYKKAGSRSVPNLYPTGHYGSNVALYVAHIRETMGSLEIRRVGFLTIYSSNLAASRKFYVDLLEFPLTREVSNEFFQIDIAGVPICVDLNEGEPRQNNIGLEVDDLAATAAVLRNKGLAVYPGRNPALMEEWVGVKDPDGNEIIFLTRKPAG